MPEKKAELKIKNSVKLIENEKTEKAEEEYSLIKEKKELAEQNARAAKDNADKIHTETLLTKIKKVLKG